MMLSFYGELARFEQLKSCTSDQTLVVLLATSGLAHLPPIKIVTILAGVAQINFLFFVIACILARGARFFALAYALRRWGEPIRGFDPVGLIPLQHADALDEGFGLSEYLDQIVDDQPVGIDE